jgi:hypothetical protein
MEEADSKRCTCATKPPATGRPQSSKFQRPGASKEIISGNPNRKHLSTSYVGRQNLTVRMQIRRFARLTNAFRKAGKPHCSGLAALHALQFRMTAPNASGDACDGSRGHRSPLGSRGHRAFTGDRRGRTA